MIRIVLVEDEDDLRGEMVFNLAADGFDVVGVANSTSLYLDLLQNPADIVILDVGLHGEDGFTIARQLRSIHSTRTMGIIMLTARSGLSDRIEGLESGADIYLLKPVEFGELSAYIHSLYRRLHADQPIENPPVWHFHQNDWKLISPSGVDIELSHLETAFVDIIARNANKPVRRRDIVTHAFGQDPLSYDNRRLEAIVSRLRKKIHRIYPLSQPIKVVHSIGYIFTDAINCI